MTTIRDLSSGVAITDVDLFVSRQGADTVDVSVTGEQIKEYTLDNPAITGVATATTIQAATSSGLTLENHSGGDVLHLANGGGVNATAYGGWNFDGATADTIASFGASKTLSSLSTATYPSLTELSYVKGATSAIQAQIDAKQASDATLTALAAYNTNGLLTQTAADTFTGRTITGTVNRVTVTNGDGVAGNPTLDISSSYVGQASITTLGTIGTGTWQGTAIANAYIASGLDAVKIGAGSVDNTEFGYLNGVTSAIQTQLNAKIGGTSGATDNAIIRADGTGGATIQTSLTSIDDSGNIVVPTGAHIGLGTGKGRFIFTDAATDLVELSTANMSIGTTASASYKLLVSDTRTIGTGVASYSVERNQSTLTLSGSSASAINLCDLNTSVSGTKTGGSISFSAMGASVANSFSMSGFTIFLTEGMKFTMTGAQALSSFAAMQYTGILSDMQNTVSSAAATNTITVTGIGAWCRGNVGTTGSQVLKTGVQVILQGTANQHYGLLLQTLTGATTNYGIYMSETSTAVKHLLAKDSQKTYFGTGEDFSIYYTGTNMVFDPELATTEIVFNETGTDTDFRVEGDTSTHLLYTDSTNSRVGINTSGPGRGLEINDASGNCLRLTYNDNNGSAANYSDFLVSSGGDLTITPSGGDTTVTGTCTISSTAIMGATLRLKGYTVATLPAGTQGDRAYATDLLTPTYGATAVGGGAVVLPVFYDGTNWVCA